MLPFDLILMMSNLSLLQPLSFLFCFSQFIDEPAETKNPGAIRALVHSLYEPPQESTPTGMRFIKDPNEAAVHQIAARCGLEPVGWILCRTGREGEKYGGKVVLTGQEVQQAARFQARFQDQYEHSRFVTIIMEHAATVEPRAYQVSDLAVALERDGIFGKPTDPNMISTRIPGKSEMIPTVVYKDRPLQPGVDFLPDEFIVKVILTSPKVPDSMFKSHEFPSNGSELYIRNHLASHARLDLVSRVSDFNLLVALVKVAGWSAVEEICDAIRTKSNLKDETRIALEKVFKDQKLV